MNSDTLLVNVKDRAALPPAQVSITDTKLLQAASEELIAYICPTFDQCNEEYWTTSSDTSIVSGTTAYDIPSRAAGGALRALKFVDVNGVEAPDPIPHIELADIGRYTSLSSSFPLGFYFTATQVVIVPAPTATSGSLRMYFSARPGALVNGTAVVTVTAPLSDTVITSGLVTPAVFAIGQLIDVVAPTPPFKLRIKDLAITGSNATTITVAGGLSAGGVAVGDYVTIAQTAYVPQIPLEWHSLLELRTCARAFAMLGDMKGAQEAFSAAQILEKRLMSQAQPRSAGNGKKFNAWR